MVTPKLTLKAIVVLFLGLVTPIFAQLKWDQPQQVFNPRPGEKVVTAKYRFTNTGPSPVAILDVRPSCGCTTATLAKKEYAPGESGEIDAKLNFSGHVGHQEKWIYVTTNLAKTDPTVLSLAVEIPLEVAIDPEFVMWRIGDPLKPKTMRVVIPDGIPAKMIAVQVDNDSMQVQLQEVEAGKAWRVKVTPTRTSEPVKAVVSIRSDYPAAHPVTYTAYARVQ
jgi:hypothetical protein